jgi:hypothetical protein
LWLVIWRYLRKLLVCWPCAMVQDENINASPAIFIMIVVLFLVFIARMIPPVLGNCLNAA